MSAAIRLAMSYTERGLIPDAVVRRGIRHLVRQRLEEIHASDCERMAADTARFVREMDAAAVAPLPEKANEQHYEVPAAFFDEVLGPRRKYSCCFFPEPETSLAEAEEAALAACCSRAGIEDGQAILELGCGWGSMTLWLAEHYPNAAITAVSNSRAQRLFIQREAMRRSLGNVKIVTADMNTFDTDARFDRVISIEMFEHMRNYRELFRRLHGWLEPGGRLFMHIFCHRTTPYAFVPQDEADWMSRHFFSGGIMPSDDLPLRFQDHLSVVDTWRWSGVHYERTANAWLARMDARPATVMPILAQAYGPEQAELWWTRWRLFFMACAELFGHDGGQEWWVSHYLFERRPG